MLSLFLFVVVFLIVGIGLAPFITPYVSIPVGLLCAIYVALKSEG